MPVQPPTQILPYIAQWGQRPNPIGSAFEGMGSMAQAFVNAMIQKKMMDRQLAQNQLAARAEIIKSLAPGMGATRMTPGTPGQPGFAGTPPIPPPTDFSKPSGFTTIPPEPPQGQGMLRPGLPPRPAVPGQPPQPEPGQISLAQILAQAGLPARPEDRGVSYTSPWATREKGEEARAALAHLKPGETYAGEQFGLPPGTQVSIPVKPPPGGRGGSGISPEQRRLTQALADAKNTTSKKMAAASATLDPQDPLLQPGGYEREALNDRINALRSAGVPEPDIKKNIKPFQEQIRVEGGIIRHALELKKQGVAPDAILSQLKASKYYTPGLEEQIRAILGS